MIQENFIRLFEDSFRNNWELPAYSNYGEDFTITYGDVAKRVARLHILFEQCRLNNGDRVSLIGRNNANWAITYIATITYGAVIVPILQDFNPNDIHHIINHSESTLLFCSDNIWENIEEDKLSTVKAIFSLNNFQCLNVGNQIPRVEGEEILHEQLVKKYLQPDYVNTLFHAKYSQGFHRDNVRYIDKSNAELVSINYTSGTTGFSKGVMLSGNALAGNITYGLRSKIIQPRFQMISFLPLAHAYGCAFEFLASTCAGCHIHFIGKIPSPKILLKAFAEIRPNAVLAVPLIIEKLYKKQIQPLLARPSMRWVLSIPFLDAPVLAMIRSKLIDAFGGNFSDIIIGGAPLNAEVEEFFTKIKFPFTVGYGMTECAPLISHCVSKEFVPKSAGKVLDIMQVKIDNPDRDGVGEICVKGENVMIGYYKNPEATKQIFDNDGWLHTGDLGTIDSEGNVFIRGRNKSMILGASGQNIFPEEIESRLNNMPFVMESLVIESNRKLIALVCPDYEAVDAEHIDHAHLEELMEENRKALNASVAAYETVSEIKLYPHEFEKTPKKSIKRYLYSTGFGGEKAETK
ncbi:MAG: AMP-binding protein [Paludibacter sp.]|jgi:long-chain acyl-CoA synthetase|nr:AMP-binding protein [Paludibacter sp.]